MGDRMTRVNLKDAHKLKSKMDWDKFHNMTDDEIDMSDIPEITDFSGFITVNPEKTRITTNFDKEVIDYFKSLGKGYQTKMNAVLRMFVDKAKAN